MEATKHVVNIEDFTIDNMVASKFEIKKSEKQYTQGSVEYKYSDGYVGPLRIQAGETVIERGIGRFGKEFNGKPADLTAPITLSGSTNAEQIRAALGAVRKWAVLQIYNQLIAGKKVGSFTVQDITDEDTGEVSSQYINNLMRKSFTVASNEATGDQYPPKKYFPLSEWDGVIKTNFFRPEINAKGDVTVEAINPNQLAKRAFTMRPTFLVKRIFVAANTSVQWVLDSGLVTSIGASSVISKTDPSAAQIEAAKALLSENPEIFKEMAAKFKQELEDGIKDSLSVAKLSATEREADGGGSSDPKSAADLLKTWGVEVDIPDADKPAPASPRAGNPLPKAAIKRIVRRPPPTAPLADDMD